MMLRCSSSRELGVLLIDADILRGIYLRTKAHLDVDRLIVFLKDIKYFFVSLLIAFYFHTNNLLCE